MKLVAVFFAVVSLLPAQDARTLLNQGVSAFKSGNYAEAVQLFQKAVDADPSSTTARLYLGTAYMQQYIPGAETPANRAFADSALREFNQLLNLDPSNRVAVASIAALYLNQKHWDLAQMWYERLTAVDPASSDGYYSLGFITWSKWYPAYKAARQQLGMKDMDPGPLPAGVVKSDLKSQYSSILEQGIQNLQKALEVNPQSDDSMAYLNLLIRERADLLDTQADYQREIAIADEWVEKALATKRQRAQANHPVGGEPMPPQRIRVAEDVQARMLTNRIDPTAPDSQSKGRVALDVIVGKDGNIQKITVLTGPPMLLSAAVQAVKQWTYRPTLLNGQPVEVVTTVTLNF